MFNIIRVGIHGVIVFQIPIAHLLLFYKRHYREPSTDYVIMVGNSPLLISHHLHVFQQI